MKVRVVGGSQQLQEDKHMLQLLLLQARRLPLAIV
jgi:hypothetical protein